MIQKIIISDTFVESKNNLIKSLFRSYKLQYELLKVSDSSVKSIFLPSALILFCFSHSERSNGRLVRYIFFALTRHCAQVFTYKFNSKLK